MKIVCVITSSRADYGLLYWTLKELKKSKNIKLKIIAAGMHFSKEHGYTYKEIIKDNFRIDYKVKFPNVSNNSKDLLNSLSVSINEFKKAYAHLNPDEIVLLGDRYEIFAASISASLSNIPIFHCHGGEVTYGSSDEYFRHCISKLSKIHFVSSNKHKKRVIQLGENPNTVFNVGALGIENVYKLKFIKKSKLEHILKIKFNKNIFLVSFHPVTLELDKTKNYLKEIFTALDNYQTSTIIFTSSNSDIFGVSMTKMIKTYVSNRKNAYLFLSLGRLLYLSIIKSSNLVIGNSSSGIIEVPSLKIPTINIGNRQEGREKAKSIINCRPIKKDIISSIEKGLSKNFVSKVKKTINPYDNGKSSSKILKIIEKNDMKNIKKVFFDVKFKL